jgi:hypothetical protein
MTPRSQPEPGQNGTVTGGGGADPKSPVAEELAHPHMWENGSNKNR